MLGIIDENGISEEQLGSALHSYFGGKYRHALIIPPDYTRLHSGAGTITRLLMGLEGTKGSVMPALGTHEPMTREQCLDFFGGSVDYDSLIVHNWRTGVERVGVVPAEYVSRVSEGLVCEPIDVELSKELLKPCYDMIISVGQVVPHEVVGMANYSKNIFVGCGGSLDVLSGTKKRAPRIFIRLKLEWLYRIASEPSRLKRFYDSNIKFLFEIRKLKKKGM